MEKNYSFMILLFYLVILNAFYFVKQNSIFLESEYVSSDYYEGKRLEMKKEHQYQLSVSIPDTLYPILNDAISKQIHPYINEFQTNIEQAGQANQYYTLYISYETYFYFPYLSYVFHIETYLGGAHPNHQIETITYDKQTKEIIDISLLSKKYPNLLNQLSEISREDLIHRPGIVDSSMMMSGTTPATENFSSFAFSKDGFLIFFPQYQVAPYSSGEFMVTIPYSKLF